MMNIYRIQEGDTLSKISKKFNISINELMRLNPQIKDPNVIYIGEPLNISSRDLSDIPKWFFIAQKEMENEVREIKGKEHNPRILEYHSTTEFPATDDETPWCSSFVNWCITEASYKGTNSAVARSWLNWGEELNIPKKGCIVILKRGREEWQGHVGFFVDIVGNHISILGGNQGNQVNISSYPKSSLLGYRWPK